MVTQLGQCPQSAPSNQTHLSHGMGRRTSVHEMFSTESFFMLLSEQIIKECEVSILAFPHTNNNSAIVVIRTDYLT